MKRILALLMALILVPAASGLAEVLCEDGIATIDACIVEYGRDYY